VKLRALWLAIGWGLVATIIWLSVTPKPPDLGVEHQVLEGPMRRVQNHRGRSLIDLS